MPERTSLTHLWPLALLALLLIIARLAQSYHAGAWLASLPFWYQVAAGFALILVFVVSPFVVWVIILGRRSRA